MPFLSLLLFAFRDKTREVFGSDVFTSRDYREVLARKDAVFGFRAAGPALLSISYFEKRGSGEHDAQGVIFNLAAASLITRSAVRICHCEIAAAAKR